MILLTGFNLCYLKIRKVLPLIEPSPKTLYELVVLCIGFIQKSGCRFFARTLMAKRSVLINNFSHKIDFPIRFPKLCSKTSFKPNALNRINIYCYNCLKFFYNQFGLLETNYVFRWLSARRSLLEPFWTNEAFSS